MCWISPFPPASTRIFLAVPPRDYNECNECQDYPWCQHSGRMWQIVLKRAYTLVFCSTEEEDILLLWIQQFSLLLHPCRQLFLDARFVWAAMSCCTLAHISAAEEVSKKLFTCLQTWETSYDVYCPFVFGRSFCSQKKAENLETLWHLASWVGG